MLYLVSQDCRFAGRVFAVDGDDIYLFRSMSAETHISNGGSAWEHAALANRLTEVAQQDDAYMVAPSFHGRAGSPPQEVIDAFGKLARGEPVQVWQPINR